MDSVRVEYNGKGRGGKGEGGKGEVGRERVEGERRGREGGRMKMIGG